MAITINGNIFKNFQAHWVKEEDILTKDYIDACSKESCDIYALTVVTLDDGHKFEKCNWHDRECGTYCIDYTFNLKEYRHIKIDEYLKQFGLLLEEQKEVIPTPVGNLEKTWQCCHIELKEKKKYRIQFYFVLD